MEIIDKRIVRMKSGDYRCPFNDGGFCIPSCRAFSESLSTKCLVLEAAFVFVSMNKSL
jgi:hypothetical protein